MNICASSTVDLPIHSLLRVADAAKLDADTIMIRRCNVDLTPAGSTAELRTLDKVNHAVSAQYGELKDNLTEIEEFYQHYNEQGEHLTATRLKLDVLRILTAIQAARFLATAPLQSRSRRRELVDQQRRTVLHNVCSYCPKATPR